MNRQFFASLCRLGAILLSVIAATHPLLAATQLTRLPVKEVTIFKDGHAFVLHAGTAAVDPDGAVRVDSLPAPVIGTFWPFAADPRAKLSGTAAGRERISRSSTALNVAELMCANVGARVVIHETVDRSYPAKIVGLPLRSAAEVAAATRAGADSTLPQPGEIVLLQTDAGTRAVRLDSIREVTFVDAPQPTTEVDELRDVLTLRLDWQGQPAAATADVGMTYLQKGLRWIPQYRVTLQPGGQALVELEATLLNELIDLDGVTAHLVIGVPSFAFEETLDPLALDQTLDQLSSYFRKAQAGGGVSSHFSNAIMLQTQTMRMGDYRSAAPEAAGGGGEVPAEVAGGDEDLFLFTLPDLTLRRGERMIVPVGRWEVTYEDLYRLQLPFAPPQELRQHFDSQRAAEIAQLLNQPRVKHVARLKNSATVPFTTAPALLMREGRILAQGIMTYTSAGSTVDLEITAAVNVPVGSEDNETGRIPDAARINDSSFQRVNLAGRITLTNFQDQPVRVEVERLLLGSADAASHGGAITRPGWHAAANQWGGAAGWDQWWWHYSWPWWWHRLNSVSRIRWVLEIPAGEHVDLTYSWYYYWG